jgi:glycosyltransferase involved in cell wall biosynthesis
VHSSRGFFVVGPNPYVVDIEHVVSFVGMNSDRLESPLVKRLIIRFLRNEKCKAVLPHSCAALRSLGLITGDASIVRKAHVIYPAVSGARMKDARSEQDRPTLLFIGEYFWKGGREVLQACKILSARLDFRLVYISLRVHPPADIIEGARKSIDIEYIEGPIPRARLFNSVYPIADVLVMPTYLDTFGYAFLEAMSFGLPCIGTRHFAVPEIIEDEVSGLLVRSPISYFDERGGCHPDITPELAKMPDTVAELVTSMERLLGSRSLRDRMGHAGFKEVANGRFSVRKRNELLREVYEASMS